MNKFRIASISVPPFLPSLALLVFLVASSVGTLTAQRAYSTPEQCRASNNLVKKTLDPKNSLFWAIDKDELGDGIWSTWRAKMERADVKHVTARIEFKYVNSDLSLSLADMSFFKRYYPLTEEGRTIWANAADRASLRQSLLIPAFIQAAQLLKDLNVKSGSCGDLYIDLLDDACLPVQNQMPLISKCL